MEEKNKKEVSLKGNAFKNIITLSSSIASLAAFVVLIFEKTDTSISWGSVIGGLLYSVWIIALICLLLGFLAYVYDYFIKEISFKRAFISLIFFGASIFIFIILIKAGYVIYDLTKFFVEM